MRTIQVFNGYLSKLHTLGSQCSRRSSRSLLFQEHLPERPGRLTLIADLEYPLLAPQSLPLFDLCVLLLRRLDVVQDLPPSLEHPLLILLLLLEAPQLDSLLLGLFPLLLRLGMRPLPLCNLRPIDLEKPLLVPHVLHDIPLSSQCLALLLRIHDHLLHLVHLPFRLSPSLLLLVLGREQ